MVKKIWSPLAAGLLAAIMIVMSAGCAGPVKNEKQLQSVTTSMQRIIQSKLANLDNDVSAAAGKIAKSGLQGDETRGILNTLWKKHPYLMDCSSADPQGKIVTMAPEEYRHYEGTDTATTDASKKFFAGLSEGRKPFLSNIFSAVEGVDAIVLIWPVVTEKGESLGSVSALFKPDVLLAETIGPASATYKIKVNVAQTDGMVIYCSDGLETGKNLLTDPKYKAYPELLAMGEKLVVEKTGTAAYTYTNDATGQAVKKTVFWTTIGLHGAEWRLASIAQLGN
jgi:branched-chain amino acid transport system substrate-binding protein